LLIQRRAAYLAFKRSEAIFIVAFGHPGKIYYAERKENGSRIQASAAVTLM